jgi:hypothetical protein
MLLEAGSHPRPMHHLRALLAYTIAFLTAAAVAGCSHDTDPPPTVSSATYRGIFVGTSAAAALSLTLKPTPVSPSAGRLLDPSAYQGKGTISGALSYDGVASYPVSGTYDAPKGVITFTANGSTFSGTMESDLYPAQLVGTMYGTLPDDNSGILKCVPDDGTVVVYCGEHGNEVHAYLGRMGFLTKGNEITGGVITLVSVYPFYGYEITGALGGGDPLQEFTASGVAGDSLALSGYVDTAVDTAGGSWDLFYPSPSTTRITGWWHTSAIGPYGVAVARRSVR